MERSAVYRRALAPIMLFAGVLGVVAAAAGLSFHLDSTRAFGLLWLGTAVVAVAGAFLIARRQAFKDNEPFWSPPTRRVAQALLPPLPLGCAFGPDIHTGSGRRQRHIVTVLMAVFLRLRAAFGGIFHAAWQ